MKRFKISDLLEPLEKDESVSKRSIIIGYLTALLYEADISGEIYLFGSYARGDYQPESDLDLLINADKENTKTIATIASKVEWTFEIPVQVLSINDFEVLPSETILIYSSFRTPLNDIFRLITYNYLKTNRSKITIFNRQLNKLIATHQGRKLGSKHFLMPLQFSLQNLLKWKTLVKFKELFHVILVDKA
ncbi:MAG: nucleotidyltransferase domain-containing protein [Candidatus Helarchaeota archaeon]